MSFIPNAFTSLNLVFGMLSIFSSIRADYVSAFWFIVAALIADGLDGRVARFLNATSDMGKELDSLSDLVSFGVAPAVLSFTLFLSDFGILGICVSIVYALCGLYRLARFNVTNVQGYFCGLAIPAAACLLSGIDLVLHIRGFNPGGLIFPFAVIIISYLMVSHVRYPNFKGNSAVRLETPALAVAGFFLVLPLFFSLSFYGLITGIFLSYAVLGVVNSLIFQFHRQ